MPINTQTNIGNITISEQAIATLTGQAVSECYGVVGMASKHILKDGFAELLGRENYAKGVEVRTSKSGYTLDLYIIISFGVKISEVCAQVQQKVKYELEKTFELKDLKVNVYVQGIRVVK